MRCIRLEARGPGTARGAGALGHRGHWVFSSLLFLGLRWEGPSIIHPPVCLSLLLPVSFYLCLLSCPFLNLLPFSLPSIMECLALVNIYTPHVTAEGLGLAGNSGSRGEFANLASQTGK